MNTERQAEYDAQELPWAEHDDEYRIITSAHNPVVDTYVVKDEQASFIIKAANAYHEQAQTIEELTAKVERLDKVAQWAQAILTALNCRDVCKESLIHKKLRQIMIEYREESEEA